MLRERFVAFDGLDYGLCIPRDQQDVCLVDTARAAGADVRERCSVAQVVWRHGRAAGVRYSDAEGTEHELHARLVVGADGRRSRIAAEVDAWTPYRGSRNGRGFAFRYMDDPMAGTDSHLEFGVYRANRTIALSLPSCPEGRVLAVWMCPAQDVSDYRKDPEAAWQRKLDDDPQGMGARLAGATNMGKVRSTADLSAYYRAAAGGRWPATRATSRTRSHGPAALGARARLDTLSTYHWGNRESRPEPTSDLVREVLGTFAGDEHPDISDTFNRVRPIETIVSPSHLVRGLVLS